MRKGELTKDRILERALSLASSSGLYGLTIGALALETKLSKSGLFAHFGSKEDLQLEVLKSAQERFEREVIRPALAKPRGLPRLRAMFENWMKWADDRKLPGGCIFIQAAVELDDRSGPAREYLVAGQKAWLAALARATQLSVEEKHFKKDVDPDQFAFELYGLVMIFHHTKRLLRDPKAEARLRRGFERLIAQSSR